MFRNLFLFIGLSSCLTSAWAQTTQPKTLQQQADVLQEQIEAFQAMSELLTDARVKARKRAEAMRAYLASVGKWKDYENAKPSPSRKGEMTFDHAVATAVDHVRQQGPVHVDVVDEAEVELLQRQHDACKRLAKKAWDEWSPLREQTRSMGAYLESIRQAEAYKKWASAQAGKQAQAHQEKLAKDQAAEVKTYKKKQAEDRQRREKIASQEREERQKALERQFQLRQQRLYNRMREHTAAPGDRWGAWGDPYDDVYRGYGR